uniref:Uncharacterized protein n=1 Tax=Aegilops tauschii subsp. strangulata TaxID=200361 RepID=A0A453ESI1_AEGTS
EQSLYENPTRPSEESNGDGYNYTGDLDVDPSSAMYNLYATYGGWDE